MKKVRSITFDKDYNATVEEVTFKDEKIPPSSKLSPIFYSLTPILFTIVIFALAVFIGISAGILSIPHITEGMLVNATNTIPGGPESGLYVVALLIACGLMLCGWIMVGSIPKEVKKE